jgi:hypothetical protein
MHKNAPYASASASLISFASFYFASTMLLQMQEAVVFASACMIFARI